MNDVYVLVCKSSNDILGVYDNVEQVLNKNINNEYIIKGPFIINNKQNNTSFLDSRYIAIDPKSKKNLPKLFPCTPKNSNNKVYEYR